jgi:hypothetical protein
MHTGLREGDEDSRQRDRLPASRFAVVPPSPRIQPRNRTSTWIRGRCPRLDSIRASRPLWADSVQSGSRSAVRKPKPVNCALSINMNPVCQSWRPWRPDSAQMIPQTLKAVTDRVQFIFPIAPISLSNSAARISRFLAYRIPAGRCAFTTELPPHWVRALPVGILVWCRSGASGRVEAERRRLSGARESRAKEPRRAAPGPARAALQPPPEAATNLAADSGPPQGLTPIRPITP